jgi:hypothetical protein
MKEHAKKLALSEVLRALSEDSGRTRISIGDLLTALGDRALGALLFIFAAPNILPTPPGTSAILGAPLMFLALQLSFGRKPWLPALITQRSMLREDFQALIRRIAPWLAKAEKLLRPRLSMLSEPPMEYVLGFICLLLALILMLPIPLGNMLPALAISLMALGVLERDGLWVLAGLIVSVVATVVVSGVVFALLKTLVFLYTQALQ